MNIANKGLLILLILIPGFAPVRSEEGLWIPLLLEKYNIEDMQEMGCRLSARQIYSINQDCLADAVVIFGRGCTGEVISSEGLVLTNHHCGFSAIQSLSSVDNDFITNGYWAMSREEELPGQDLTVTFLRYIEDVTDKILEGTDHSMDDEQKEVIIQRNMHRLTADASDDNGSRAVIKPFYYGNEFYLFVYDVFRDIRLVGAPPNSIGNFGGDPDNWIWPRHTGDFSLFRIYADKDNAPTDYSPDNIPYKPRKHFEISLNGVSEGDFTMVLGYPGRTEQFLYSDAVQSMVETILPHGIQLRTLRLDIMNTYMKESEEVRIQYASKFNGISNYWKKWQGTVRGLKNMDAVTLKKEKEAEFIRWMNADDLRVLKYDWIMPEFRRVYGELDRYALIMQYLDEAVSGVELYDIMLVLNRLMSQGESADDILSAVHSFYRNYFNPIDRDVFAVMMKAFYSEVDPGFHPGFFKLIDKKYKGDFDRFAEVTYNESMLSSYDKVAGLLDIYAKDQSRALKLLLDDPVARYFNEFRQMYLFKIYPEWSQLNQNLEKIYKGYTTAIREMYSEAKVYPDANFTMRLSYGKVEGYLPSDAVIYDYATTMSGIMEKNSTGGQEYVIPEKLKELYLNKDFGEYGINGCMPVCFITSTHTTNGNSGSPVLDADGRLIGLNFDRNWEGTMSDILYDPDQCRNIAVDIRYVLFIIDKFAGAGYLLEEMEIMGEWANGRIGEWGNKRISE